MSDMSFFFLSTDMTASRACFRHGVGVSKALTPVGWSLLCMGKCHFQNVWFDSLPVHSETNKFTRLHVLCSPT